jgi:arginine deiminase
MNPKKLIMIEDDAGWIAEVKKYFTQTKCIFDQGTDYEKLIEDHPDVDLILIDYDLGEDRPNGSQILNRVKSLNKGACVGIVSIHKKGGFLASDAAVADFFVDKEKYIDRREAFKTIAYQWNEYMKVHCAPKVQSEWDTLKTVIIHTPSTELRYVDPEDPSFLMEEIPDENRAEEEHRKFILMLQELTHCRVLDIRDLITDVFALCGNEHERAALLAELVFGKYDRALYELFQKNGVDFPHLGTYAIGDMKKSKPEEIVRYIYEGWNTENWSRYRKEFKKQHVSLFSEMNNAYFTRDPGFALDGMFVVSSMTKKIRQRETRVLDTVLKKHPWFKDRAVESFSSDTLSQRIEGGDVVAIGPQRLAVGWSERSSFESIEKLAHRLLSEKNYKEVYAIPIPRRRAFMHLDTVFSLVGQNTAVVHPEAMDIDMGFYKFNKQVARGKTTTEKEFNSTSFIDYLKKQEGFSIIETAGGNVGLAKKEQFTDATNCLAVGEKRVVSYEGNRHTNEALEAAGVEVYRVEGYELVKGRGGPRCMSMPISRKTS